MESKKKLQSLLAYKPASVEPGQVVVAESALTGLMYPVVFTAQKKHVLLSDWIKNNKAHVQETLQKQGAILFRNFNMQGVQSFREFVNVYGNEVLDYSLGAAKRSKIVDKIYLSTHHPADENLEMHNEMSYTANWPTEIAFYCQVAAEGGGETPIADCRSIWNKLSAPVQQKLTTHGIKYVRRIGGMLGGLTWQQVFQTESKDDVERSCKENKIDFEWQDENVLVMNWVLPAFRIHPQSAEKVWFNHAYFFNAMMLNTHIAATLQEKDIPFFAYYGDGSAIEPETLHEIKSAFESAKCDFPWQQGDVLLLDNLLMAHGRNAYRGNREVLVAMFRNIN